MQPKVSVIVTVYNGEDYLEECLNSLTSQSLKDIEVIVVNDGSTDKTIDILTSFEHKDPRVKAINKANTGYGNSMNLGIAAATGEYIGIVDSDDYCEPLMYEDLYTLATTHDLDFVRSDFSRFVDIEGRRVFDRHTVCPEGISYETVFDPSSDSKYLDIYMLGQPGIYRKQFLTDKEVILNETPGASFQDNGFWIQVFTQAKRALVTQKDHYKLRRDNPNSSVHDRAKVYCMCEESDFILAFFDRHPEIKERFVTKFSVKRFGNYMFTLNRIDPRFKIEFLKRFADDFNKADSLGQIDRSLFDDQGWEHLSAIMEDPEEFFYYFCIGVPSDEVEARLAEQKEHYENSTTWRIGSAITAIPRFFKRALSGKKK